MKNIFFSLYLIVLFGNFIFCFETEAEDISKPVVIIPITRTPPIIDGKDKDSCWQNAVKFGPLIKFNPAGKHEPVMKPECVMKLIAGSKALYIYASFNEPEIDKMVIKDPLSDKKSLSNQFWLEDHWEFFISPVGSNHRFQFMGDPENRGVMLEGKKESKLSVKSISKIYDDRWTVEIRIPAELLNVDLSDCPAFRFNFFRVRRVSGVELSCWTPVRKRFADWPNFGWLIIGSTSKNMIWLRNRFVGKQQFEQMVEIKEIFKQFKLKDTFYKQFDTLSQDIRLLKNPPADLSINKWEKIAARSQTLPERIRKLWENAKLLEIVR